MWPPPLHEQDFQQWVREKWLEDFPNLPFPENFQALPIPPAEPVKKIGRYVLNDLKLPSGRAIIKDPNEIIVPFESPIHSKTVDMEYWIRFLSERT
jgi:hypothetical protein